MTDLMLSSLQRDNVLAIYQRGLAAALAENYSLAITHLLAVMQCVTATTWPVIYHDAAIALSAAYIALDQGDLRENARQADHWDQEARHLQMPRGFP